MRLAAQMRGGFYPAAPEAIAHAAQFNRLSHYPDDAKVTFNFHFDIKSLVAQSQKRSAVFDIITNPSNVFVTVN